MSNASVARHVVVLAPMPIEMDAVVGAFGLHPSADDERARWTGLVGNTKVTAVHIGMGPQFTREATVRLLDPKTPDHELIDHVMIAGICGGLDPSLEVGTLINPDLIVDGTTGATYRHSPPGDAPRSGKLITTEQATLDINLSRQFFDDGCVAVDMESSAVAEVCEAYLCPWSVYRCIGDRYFDGLLDQRVLEATNADGSGDMAAIGRLIAAEPELGAKLERLGRDATRAARLAAEAAVRGCEALARDDDA
jgi:nucleoside phosphorylase